MRAVCGGLVLGAALSLVVTVWAGERRGGPPPLVVGEDAQALPDEPVAGKAKGKGADNAACFVCHANYKTETLATMHAAKNVGCAQCHGPSDAHCNDENNTTPPDVLFAADRIDAACRKCHETHSAAPAKVVARWRERCPTKTDPAAIVCTDCHGTHRLRVRTVRWDKRTRKLLPATPKPTRP